MMRVFESNKTRDAEIQRHKYEVQDKRGRWMGCEIVTGTVEYQFTMDPNRTVFAADGTIPGLYFWFRPHTTRDGNLYGPMLDRREFDTIEKRDAAIAKYLRDAKKRAGATEPDPEFVNGRDCDGVLLR